MKEVKGKHWTTWGTSLWGVHAAEQEVGMSASVVLEALKGLDWWLLSLSGKFDGCIM